MWDLKRAGILKSAQYKACFVAVLTRTDGIILGLFSFPSERRKSQVCVILYRDGSAVPRAS